MTKNAGIVALLLAILVSYLAAQEEERPLGWVGAAPDGSTLSITGTRTPQPAQPGDFVFAGDKLSSGPGVLTFYYCPDSGSLSGQVYALHGSVQLTQSLSTIPGGSTLKATGALNPCDVPALEREPDVTTVLSTSQLHVTRFSAQQMASAVARLGEDPRKQLQQLLKHADDPNRRLVAAALLERANLNEQAAWEYFQVAERWSGQPRLLKHIQHLLEAPTHTRLFGEPEAQPPPQPNGNVYALVVGITHYEQAPKIKDLEYAARDAELFAQYLRSPRGGAKEVVFLPDAQATSGAIRNYFMALKRKAGKRDTVWLFVAAHGGMLPEGKTPPGVSKMPSILTHRADPQDVNINSVSLQDAEDWMLGRAAPFGAARVFLDVCGAGYFVQFSAASASPTKNYFGILATHAGPDAVAYENKLFDGGHGAFTYFLLRGLNTDEAREPGDLYVRAARLTSYVTEAVEKVTSFHQMPTPMVRDLSQAVADFKKQGIQFKQVPLDQLRIPQKELDIGRRGGKKAPAADQQRTQPATETKPTEGPAGVQASIVLEDRGEQILLDYLKGEEVPQTADEFHRGGQIFDEALRLQPGSPYLSARELFCQGRFLVFQKDYHEAVDALQRSIRLEPRAAYAYNALGIAYLETARYSDAEMAFADAIDRAPRWAYPRHNLGLTHWQQGRYDQAIADYRAAMEQAPRYFYLPYNLGLLYATLNRSSEAEEMFRHAIDLAPGRAEPLTALGQLEARNGSDRKAKQDLERALSLPGQTITAQQAARHNYALVLAKRRATFDEALKYWRLNGDYLPSQFSMAAALARNGNTGKAIDQYQQILRLVPESIAARLELVDLMEGGSYPVDDEIHVLREGLCDDPGNAVLLERLGVVLWHAGRSGNAAAALREALKRTADPTAQQRIRKRLKSITVTPVR
ncbi:MAG TPA: tetratricopeptide repeat protein [Bryobacteraceae bacterium]|nr:tetratricopeptide repeat protein [Bryobacteraceae bacterium]